MSNNKCSEMHKLGPFELNEDGGATRKCLCEDCDYVEEFPVIGDDIKEAIERQEDVNFFCDFLVDKRVNFTNSDFFMEHIKLLIQDIDYLDIDDETQNKLFSGIDYYNTLLNKQDEDRFKLISDVNKFLKLYFKRNKYEYKNGFGSFLEETNEDIDTIHDNIYSELSKILDKKNHLSK